MQPIVAIPPYDPEQIKKLVGQTCRVPRLSNDKKWWWVEIVEVIYVNPQIAYVRLAGHRHFGLPRMASLNNVRWSGHITDPLLQQIAKARGEAKRAS